MATRTRGEGEWSRADPRFEHERQQEKPYVLPEGVKPKRWPHQVVADETDFFGWYFQLPRTDTLFGWPTSHLNWMAERLQMNRTALDRAIYRARHRQENDDDPPFYRLRTVAGNDRQRVQHAEAGVRQAA